MNQENQNIEWKETWHDEYLKWVCGFANAQGGSVYDDKIIMWNQGQLPENWTIAQLLQKHPSLPYNPAISNTFFRAGFIESWGKGMLQIIDDCVEDNAPVPIFRYDFSGFIVNFPFKKFGVNDPINDPVNDPVSQDKTIEKIIVLMKKTPEISKEQIAEQLSISVSTVKRHIRILRQNNKIARKGSNKLGVWEIIKT